MMHTFNCTVNQSGLHLIVSSNHSKEKKNLIEARFVDYNCNFISIFKYLSSFFFFFDKKLSTLFEFLLKL
jgi:hypothetical protein